MPELEVIGHRGNGAGPDENTLTSCLAAVLAGADAVEVDVRQQDGELVTGHDRGQRADSLRNIVENVPVPLILHIKESGGRRFSPPYYRGIIDRVIPLIAGRPVTLSSFSPGALTYLKRRYPQVRTGFATVWAGYDLHLAGRLGADEYHTWTPTLTRRAASLAHRQDISLVVIAKRYHPRTAQRLAQLGVDRVMTDDIRAWRKASAGQ